MRTVLLLLGVLILAGCDHPMLRDHPLLKAPPPSLGTQLKGDDIKSTLSGNSLLSVEEHVPPLVLFFAPSGEMHGLRSNNYRDRGTWGIEDDAICGKWQNWYGTLSNCWEVFRDGPRLTLKRVAGAGILATTLATGNVIDL